MNIKYEKVIALVSEIKELANLFIVSRMKSLGIEGMVTSHGNIMGLLFTQGPCNMVDISRQIKRKKNTVTTLVNKLVDQGYVQISADDNDHRVKMVSLTEKSMVIREDFFKLSNELIELTFKDIEEAKRVEIVQCLQQIRDNLS